MTWHAVVAHRSLAVLLTAGLPVEIAAAANLVMRVGSVDSTGGGPMGIGAAFAAMSLAFAVAVVPAGILVDRTAARRTFATALAVRAGPMLLGGWVILAGTLNTTMVVFLAAVDGLGMALLRPSWQHFQAGLLPAGAVRHAAILDDWIARAGALIGAVAGGAAVALGHSGIGLIACAGAFLPLLAAVACGLGAPADGIARNRRSPESLRDAWATLCGIPRLVQATRADVILALALPVGVLAPAVTVALSAVEHLWLIALAAGVGALGGTTWVTLAWNRTCPGRLLRSATTLLVAVLAIQAVELAGGIPAPTPGWLAAACVSVALAEAATSAMVAVTGALVQSDAPARLSAPPSGCAGSPGLRTRQAQVRPIRSGWRNPATSDPRCRRAAAPPAAGPAPRRRRGRG